MLIYGAWAYQLLSSIALPLLLLFFPLTFGLVLVCRFISNGPSVRNFLIALTETLPFAFVLSVVLLLLICAAARMPLSVQITLLLYRAYLRTQSSQDSALMRTS